MEEPPVFFCELRKSYMISILVSNQTSRWMQVQARFDAVSA